LLEFQEVEATGAEPYTTVYDPPSYDIGFGPNVYEAPGGGQFGPSPTNAQIEQQIGYQPTQVAPQAAPTSAYTGGGIQAKPFNIPPEGRQGYSLAYEGTPIVPTSPSARTPSGAIDIGFGPGKDAPAPQEKSLFDKLSTPDMVRLGLAGAGALVGAGTARKAAEAGRAGKAELQTLATPYQQTGAQVQAQAQRGELTPAGQQSLQAMQARLAQGAESRGGVGTAQAVAQLEALRQSLLQQQMDYGLKISGIGDNIAMGAIRTGLQADQAVNQLTNSMYSNMLYLASGMYPGVSRAQTTVGT